MSTSTPNSHLGRLRAGLLLALATLAASLAALAPAASAEEFPGFSFAPGAFAKAHPPLNQEPPIGCISFQCVFFVGGLGGGLAAWVQAFRDASEPTQAGAHPDFTTHFRFAQTGKNHYLEAGHPHTIITDAPPGAIGNPLAVPRCEAADFHLTVSGACPPESQVGTAVTAASLFAPEDLTFLSPVSSIVPAPGQPALLGFKSFVYTALLNPEIRSDSDYGLRITAPDIPLPLGEYLGNTVTLWGVPHDPVHDVHRFNDTGSPPGHLPEGTIPVPFLTAPTNCSTGPIALTQKMFPWEHPDLWAETTSVASEPTGCDELEFDPDLSARPSTEIADSPTGLEVDVHTPQNNKSCVKIEPAPPKDEPQYDCGLATSHLKDTTVTLPEGLTINPSGANGLDGCSPAEIGLTTPLGVSPQQFTKDQPSCPDASRIAGVEVDTPLLDAPMPGSVYIADPYDNPFESLLAIYVVADDTERGVIVKLAGKVEPDPATGRLVTRVTDAPQVPFEHFLLHFKQGPHAALRTPPCGEYSTTASLTPYSAPGSPVAVSDDWSIAKGPGGGCAVPNEPSFDAGTVSPIAGAESPFVMHLRREDASQNFSALTLNPPPGLLAKLAGTEICSEAALAAAKAKSGAAEKANPSCPANSRLGSVVAGAGAGPTPYYAPGTVYLAGPYKGAPLSLAIVAPATAGPFDLGTVVTRVAAYVDPNTAQITAVSDPLPTILKGVPLDIRTVDVSLDRPHFTRNPTSCDPMAIKGLLTSTLSQTASLESRFQLGECGRLGFRPQVFLRLFGKRFSRGANPRLRAVIVPRAGDANISRIAVTMPRSLFLDQSHIRTVCTRVQFAADACPPGSIYGEVVAQSPLVDYPLEGNVYLRSSNHKLPDLVADLRGPDYQPVRIEGVGRTDSVKGALRNTFDIVPDAPVSKIVLLLQAGPKSLLVASRNLCKGVQRARVDLSAHNGRQQLIQQKISIPRCDRNRKAAKRRLARRSAAG